jgi:hypothetical protein
MFPAVRCENGFYEPQVKTKAPNIPEYIIGDLEYGAPVAASPLGCYPRANGGAVLTLARVPGHAAKSGAFAYKLNAEQDA